MEINRLKYYLAPFLGLSIALPILSLIIYFLIEGSFNFNFLKSNTLIEYTKNTSLLIFGTFALVVIIGTITSYLSARFEYFGSKFFAITFVLPLAYPAYILGYSYVGFFEYRGILSDIIGSTDVRFDILICMVLFLSLQLQCSLMFIF